MTTREDRANVPPLFALRLPPDPSCVGTARRRLRAALEELGRGDLVDDATLVVSELVTNALLHAGGEISVVAAYGDEGLLVQVTDHSPHVPRPRRYGEESRTGRGLHLIESLSDEWGFLRHPEGKTVWVRWRPHPAAGSAPVTRPEVVDPPQPTLTGGPAPDTIEVVFLELPLLLLAAWREHAQALLRDYLLASLGGDSDELVAVQVHAEVTDALAVLDEQFPRPIEVISAETSLAGAVEPEVTVPRAVVRVPHASVPHFATVNRASDAALAMADAGQLLTPPTLPEVRALRRWLCGQVLSQADGHAPVPFSVPPDPTLPVLGVDGWDTRTVTLATDGRIAVDTHSRILAVSRPATALLGYADPGELVGRRLVSIIPPRLRQAHVAGMTMYLLTGRRPLIGTRVTVPACRRDGREVLVDLLIREEATVTERPVLIAEIRAAVAPG